MRKAMKTNKGFSLIEVLVALLLTTIGVLGMVALQGRSIQYTQDSVQRNTAILLSGDLIEIIRAHPKELFNTSPPQFPMNSGLKSSSMFYKEAGSDFIDRESCVASPTRIAQTAKELRDCWADKVEAAPSCSTAIPTSAEAPRRAVATARARCSRFIWPGKFEKAPVSTRAIPTTPSAPIPFG